MMSRALHHGCPIEPRNGLLGVDGQGIKWQVIYLLIKLNYIFMQMDEEKKVHSWNGPN